MNKFGRDFMRECKKAGIKVTKSTYIPTKEETKRLKAIHKEFTEFLKKIDRAEKASRKSKLKFTIKDGVICKDVIGD